MILTALRFSITIWLGWNMKLRINFANPHLGLIAGFILFHLATGVHAEDIQSTTTPPVTTRPPLSTPSRISPIPNSNPPQQHPMPAFGSPANQGSLENRLYQLERKLSMMQARIDNLEQKYQHHRHSLNLGLMGSKSLLSHIICM